MFRASWSNKISDDFNSTEMLSDKRPHTHTYKLKTLYTVRSSTWLNRFVDDTRAADIHMYISEVQGFCHTTCGHETINIRQHTK